METWFNKEQLAVIHSVFRAAGIDSEPWWKKLARSVQNAIDSGISPDQAAQSEYAIYQEISMRLGYAKQEVDIEALKQEILLTVQERRGHVL